MGAPLTSSSFRIASLLAATTPGTRTPTLTSRAAAPTRGALTAAAGAAATKAQVGIICVCCAAVLLLLLCCAVLCWRCNTSADGLFLLDPD